MHLMMIGSTPMSPLVPKIVREEVAYIEGDLNLSDIDGETDFEQRSITYTFVAVQDYIYHRQNPLDPTPVIPHVRTTDRNKETVEFQTSVYNWLFKEKAPTTLPTEDVIAANEMYDHVQNGYKYIDVSVDEVSFSKALFDDMWVDQVSITFKMNPYLQTYTGARVDLATYIDRSRTGRETQTLLMIFNNDSYSLNDNIKWASGRIGDLDREGWAEMVAPNHWLFYVRVAYGGAIGVYIDHSPSISGRHYPISSASGIYFLDNDHPGEVLPSKDGGYGYAYPRTTGTGDYVLALDITFEQDYTWDDPPWICFEWGVLRSFSVPDQEHYIMDAYTKGNTATMYVNFVVTPFSTEFILPSQPLNEIQIFNNAYDGMYKLRYDTTSRRL